MNLSYTDVERTVVNGVPVYDRTLDQANVITPFGTLPSGVDWGQVPGDLLVQLGAGIGQAIDEGFVGDTPVVNPLAILANLLGLDGLPGAAGAVGPLSEVTNLSELTESAVDAAASAAIPAVAPPAVAPPAAAAVPSDDPAPTPAAALADKADTDSGTTSVVVTSVEEDDAPAKPDKRASAPVERGADSLKKVVKGVQDGLRKTVKAVTGAGKPAQKPDDGADSKPADKPSGDSSE